MLLVYRFIHFCACNVATAALRLKTKFTGTIRQNWDFSVTAHTRFPTESLPETLWGAAVSRGPSCRIVELNCSAGLL